MIFSGADLCGFEPLAFICGVGGVAYAYRIWIRIIVAGVVAELAIVIGPPGVGVSVAAQGQRMRVSGADLCGFESFACVVGVGGVAYAHRNMRIRIVAAGVVAELAIVVVSPGVNVSVAAQGQRMITSGADLCGFEPLAFICGVGGVAYAYRNWIRIIAAGSVVAELAIVVISPGVNVSVAAQGQRILISGADLHVGEIRWPVGIRLGIRLLHHDRCSLGFGCSIAELAICVVSPGVGVPVTAHR